MNQAYTILILYACIVIALIYIARILIFGASSAKKVSNKKKHHLSRHLENPVVAPILHKEWEAVGTFNPAAVKDDEDFVHLLYRAVGADGLSRVGHAKSRDGFKFDKRSSYPVFISNPTRDSEPKDKDGNDAPQSFNQAIYTSGGGWGGCEDPRAVVIDGRVYMTYTAFEGWDSVRIAITSLSVKDLKASRWNWKKPRLISAPDEINKNWVLFPEKINGKYAILHTLSPKIMVEYVDSLDHFSGYIRSPRLQGPQPGRKDFWDNTIRGSGPPPIKTRLGWLLLYHAIDKKEWNRYKLGAMILDANDPTRILYRSHEPILAPDMPYENDWKPGVVYASGALILNEKASYGGDLVVYYGGGDKYVCVARTPLQPLLDWLVAYGQV